MRWKTGLGNRLSIANLPTNMLCGLVLLAGEFGVNAEGWFAGMRMNVQEIHDPLARVSYRQASEIIRMPANQPSAFTPNSPASSTRPHSMLVGRLAIDRRLPSPVFQRIEAPPACPLCPP